VRNHIGYLRLDPRAAREKIAEWNRPVWWPIPLLALPLAGIAFSVWYFWRRRERETAARTLCRRKAPAP
jgi:hypothetical protein